MSDLVESAKNLLEACYQADAREELPESIDGSLLDAVRDGLLKSAERDIGEGHCKLCDSYWPQAFNLLDGGWHKPNCPYGSLLMEVVKP